MLGFIAVWLGFAVFVFFARPSKYLFGVVNREFNPSPQEEELRFYRRGHTYNAIGGLKGTHAFAFAWALVIVLPLAMISGLLEAGFDLFTARQSRARPAS